MGSTQDKSDSLTGDGYCNDETNTAECELDGGDCCGSCINTDRCTDCYCHSQDVRDGAPNALVGDGFCNDEMNNANCDYDGGDCCGSCINMEYCSECKCLEQILGNPISNALVGNGFCNKETNNADCNYDGGDCCDDMAELTDGSCKIKESCTAGFAPFFVGDGYCNDETNLVECLFDGLDCGQTDNPYDIDTSFCIDCEPHDVESMF